MLCLQKNATRPYLHRLFEDPGNPSAEPVHPDNFEGSFAVFGFSFLCTLLELSQETGSLTVQEEDGDPFAFLALERGEIVHARLEANPFYKKEDVIQFLMQSTPARSRFQFQKTLDIHLKAEAL